MWLEPKMNKACHLFCSCPLEIKHLIAEPLNATNIGLLWLFLQTLLMSIYCKRHVQCSLVSTQPHKAFDFVLTLCTPTSDHLWLDLSCRTWVWHVTWPIMARSHLVSNWAVLGGDATNTRLRMWQRNHMDAIASQLYYTNENNPNQMHYNMQWH